MWAFVIPVFLFSVIVGLVTLQAGSGADEARSQVESELAMYSAFMATADAYFKVAAPPSGKTVYRWNDIRSAAAPSVANMGVKSSWRVVRDASGKWAACTELSPVALAEAGGMFPAPETGGLSSRVVSLDAGASGVGVGDDALVTQAVDLCKGT